MVLILLFFYSDQDPDQDLDLDQDPDQDLDQDLDPDQDLDLDQDPDLDAEYLRLFIIRVLLLLAFTV